MPGFLFSIFMVAENAIDNEIEDWQAIYLAHWQGVWATHFDNCRKFYGIEPERTAL